MTHTLQQRLVLALRQDLARSLSALCSEVGAAESSILLPRGEGELYFFASSNPVLLQPGVPTVPIGTSFSGLAFRSGQTIAFADAATQAPHYKAVDEMVGTKTHEFAAIPISGRTTLGVLTLVNRATLQDQPVPFEIGELRRGEALARDMAQPIALLSGLVGGTAEPEAGSLEADLLADLALLDPGERRVVHSLASALLQNRTE